MKKLAKFVGMLTLLIAGIFIIAQQNENQEVQAQPGETKYCSTTLPGWPPCIAAKNNCLCPIIVVE